MLDSVEFTDEHLTAYLDGEADAELHTSITDALQTEAQLGERLAQLDIPVAAITQAYHALLDQAPAMPPLQTPYARGPRQGFSIWGTAGVFGTGITAGLAMAVFSGLGTPEPKQPGWKAVAASYQSLYSTETFTAGDIDAIEAQLQLAHVSQVLGTDVTQLPQVSGLTFKRAQVLGFKGKPLAQLSFARTDGTPIALCIINTKNQDRQPIKLEELFGMAAASWNVDGVAYLLIGGDAAPITQTEAKAFET